MVRSTRAWGGPYSQEGMFRTFVSLPVWSFEDVWEGTSGKVYQGLIHRRVCLGLSFPYTSGQLEVLGRVLPAKVYQGLLHRKCVWLGISGPTCQAGMGNSGLPVTQAILASQGIYMPTCQAGMGNSGLPVTQATLASQNITDNTLHSAQEWPCLAYKLKQCK